MTNDNCPFVPSPDLDPQLESAVWSVLSEPIDMVAVERVKTRAQSMPENSHQQAQLRTAMTTRRRVLAFASIAAGIMLVLGAAVLTSSPSTAFAHAIEQLKSAGAFRYTTLIYTDQQKQPIEAKVMVAANGRQRSETSGTISLMDSDGQLHLTLIEATKTAIVSQEKDEPQGPALRQLTWIEQLKSHGDKPDKELGTKELDGRTVQGFVVKQGLHDFTIWVDAKTNELVQIENGGMIKGSSIKRVVMQDFQFNQTFDESLFSFDVPDGFKVMNSVAVPVRASGEDAIVQALRGYTKVADGKFPESIANWGEWAVLFSKKGVPREESAAVMSSLGAITPFLFSLPKDDYEYLGAGKTTADPRTIVFWHRTKDGSIRAIYNDLSVAVIDEADLPQSK